MITDILGDLIDDEDIEEQAEITAEDNTPVTGINSREESTENGENTDVSEDTEASDDVEIVKEVIEDEPPVNVVADDTFYTMDQAAEELKDLNITPNSLRTFLNELGEEHIDIARTPGGHRRLTYENIQTIRRYQETMKNYSFTVKQLKEFLYTKEGKITAKTSGVEQLTEIFSLFRTQNRADFEDMASSLIDKIQSSNQLLLEHKDAEVANAAKEIKESVKDDVKAEVGEMEKRLKGQIEALSSLINTLAADNKKKDEQIAKLQEQNEQIIANTARKSRWPFKK